MNEKADKVKPCNMRHENGNCLPAGDFCTANKNICVALQNAYRAGYMVALGDADKTETLETTLHIGDEVSFENGRYEQRSGIIINTNAASSVVFDTYGAIEWHMNPVYTKTGRTFPEIPIALRKAGFRILE